MAARSDLPYGAKEASFAQPKRQAPAGWYKDPAGSGQLRFYDGHAWTWKTRPLPRRRLNALGMARARAGVASAQRSALRPPAWLETVFSFDVAPESSISRPRATATRSGSVLGMLSLTVALVATVGGVVLGWQLWGTGLVAQQEQTALVAELESEGLAVDVPLDALPVATDSSPQLLDESIEVGSEQDDSTVLDALGPVADPAPADPADQAENVGGSGKPVTVQKTTHADIVMPPAGWQPPLNRESPPTLKADGKAYGTIRIPRLGVDAAIVSGTSEKALKAGPGVWRYGALPGQPGNATIAGHRTTYGAWFNRLDELRYGDRIYIDVPGQPTAVYEVRGRAITSPDNVAITRKTKGVRLTLSTCHPKYSADYRLVVQAELVDGAWADKAVNRSKWKLLD